MGMFQPFKPATRYQAPKLMQATMNQGIFDAQAKATENAQRAATYAGVGQMAGAYDKWGDENDVHFFSDALRKAGIIGAAAPTNDATQEGLISSMPSMADELGGIAGMPSMADELGGVADVSSATDFTGVPEGMASIANELRTVDTLGAASPATDAIETATDGWSSGMPNTAGVAELLQGNLGGAALNAGVTAAANTNPWTAAALQLYKLFGFG